MKKVLIAGAGTGFGHRSCDVVLQCAYSVDSDANGHRLSAV